MLYTLVKMLSHGAHFDDSQKSSLWCVMILF